MNVELLGMLPKYEKFVMGLSTLKRYLKRVGLRRRVPHGSKNKLLLLLLLTYFVLTCNRMQIIVFMLKYIKI